MGTKLSFEGYRLSSTKPPKDSLVDLSRARKKSQQQSQSLDGYGVETRQTRSVVGKIGQPAPLSFGNGTMDARFELDLPSLQNAAAASSRSHSLLPPQVSSHLQATYQELPSTHPYSHTNQYSFVYGNPSYTASSQGYNSWDHSSSSGFSPSLGTGSYRVPQQSFAVQAPISGEPPGGAFYPSSPYHNHSDMNEDALAASAAAAVVGLGASVDSDSRLEDALDGESQDPFTPRRGHTHKRPEEPPRNDLGKITCRFQNTCAGLTFDRKCEWSKHMDKHERPYKCAEPGCEKLQGFTYSGGLLRHQREVHKMHGGTKEPLYCPFPNCKRNQGQGFTRKENRDEHIRRVHRRATDGTDTLSIGKRDRDTMESTDPLLQSALLATQEVAEEINENLDPNVDSPIAQPNLKRRRTQITNGNGIVDHIDGDLEVKSAMKRLQESNNWLLKQNQQLQEDYNRLATRISRLESDLGSHLVSGARCAVDTRMSDD
ncbi:hypothetical protein BT63DRAFT_443459 [Microthyrium microscopicum]|uniref:C2H2-type domain-containing protein n=1 Tax=Microthyrium microscopicum TaxID=703497 RepID=A0A6A6U2L5_9PEZI|nr:hypothetical protein BT63DRAFT_443459 [Microthyrium microscopicum]